MNCTNECGQCLNDTVCDVENGTCLSGCNPGWKGFRCNEGRFQIGPSLDNIMNVKENLYF